MENVKTYKVGNAELTLAELLQVQIAEDATPLEKSKVVSLRNSVEFYARLYAEALNRKYIKAGELVETLQQVLEETFGDTLSVAISCSSVFVKGPLSKEILHQYIRTMRSLKFKRNSSSENREKERWDLDYELDGVSVYAQFLQNRAGATCRLVPVTKQQIIVKDNVMYQIVCEGDPGYAEVE